ncbi:universal stress protein [Peteryoungia desertarenae]|uniref:Universal stress protein n=1 Tax=Peteryoungia desertarenae TaxID=1813451 RepID=A0ABX6QPS4_9HYPH|nr:universal stress protein [Peteryoungia desertarenae]QLF70252.1 universal stress protein [Peteryoungia desertarenae]
MEYKTLLAILDTPKNAERIADFAFALSQQFKSHVIGAHTEPLAMVPIVAPMEIPDPASIQALQDMAHAETESCEKLFRSKGDREGISYEWRSFMSSAGFNTSALIDSARAADLVIAPQAEGEMLSGSGSDLESFLFESGRPVLLVPYIYKEVKPIKRVMIAWNGSREAARATFDALPFLIAADAVEVLSIDAPDTATQSGSIAGAEIAATLSRHGVNVTIHSDSSSSLRPETMIENRLADQSVDLLVMGAYGSPRWWEMLFGGVTKTLLHSMTALTLMSR